MGSELDFLLKYQIRKRGSSLSVYFLAILFVWFHTCDSGKYRRDWMNCCVKGWWPSPCRTWSFGSAKGYVTNMLYKAEGVMGVCAVM